VKLGLACNCRIIQENYFARKNYFYPDLPKGYQISQHTTPICINGLVEINPNEQPKMIRINRIHIEEDAGKSIHNASDSFTDIDCNRAGMPLLEIVSEPDINSADEAFAYVSHLRKLVRHLDVSDGNMEEGNLRCDVNISVRLKGDERLGTKVEIKNLNSLRYIKKAIEFERQRLIALHQSGSKILQETRGFDENNLTTFSIRTKEDEDDYRYFPEPDLPPFFISKEMIDSIKGSMPPLEEEVKESLIRDFQLSDYDARQLATDLELSKFYLQLVRHTNNYKAAANWLIGPVKNYLNQNELSLNEFPVPALTIAQVITLIDSGWVSYGIASQKVFPELIKNPGLLPEQYIKEQRLEMNTHQTEIDDLIEASLTKFSEKIKEYKKGKKGLISLFVGEVMKQSKGKADAKMVTEKIIEKLKA
jgi:aspartyl-tRNA(Asn)/glutamyl-tRNA(Gln) amidotransferase subunit B